MKRTIAILAFTACSFGASGCDLLFGTAVFGEFVEIAQILQLKNNTNSEINVGLYFSDNADLSEAELREQGEIFEATIPAGGETTIEQDIANLKQFMVGSAFFTGSTEDSSSSVFKEGTDFNVGDDGNLTESVNVTFTSDTDDRITTTVERFTREP